MKQVLITGATGFIGCRLAEIMVERGIPVVALVRSWSRVVRLARLPVRMVHGNILDLDSLREAMDGCDIVFHCAAEMGGDRNLMRRSIFEGTANVMQAAVEKGVRKVVYLSSAAVYGHLLQRSLINGSGLEVVTEDELCRYSGDVYGDTKIDAERIAQRYHYENGLPVVILRPPFVYGPFGPETMRMIDTIREGNAFLVDGGKGICNCVYIDNLIEAILLAAVSHVSGEAFFISDAEPITWKEYTESHARALGNTFLPLPELDASEMRTLRFNSLFDHSIEFSKRLARKLLPAKARHFLKRSLLSERFEAGSHGCSLRKIPPLFSEAELNLHKSNVVFSIAKGRRMLGYDPKISFKEGMERTSAWMKWAQLSN